MARRAGCLAVGTMLVACGGRVADEGAATSDTDANHVDATIAETSNGADWEVAPRMPSDDVARGEVAPPDDPRCPPVAPADGAACLLESGEADRFCTYGDSVIPDCRTKALCTRTGAWQVVSRCDADLRCASASPETGGRCFDKPRICGWADGTLCGCVVMLDSDRWVCRAPTPGCPKYVPNAGSSCADEGRVCNYGDVGRCSWGVPTECLGGRWRWRMNCTE